MKVCMQKFKLVIALVNGDPCVGVDHQTLCSALKAVKSSILKSEQW